MTKQSETRDRVLDLIEQLGVGEAIPSERQLSADLGVSRLTVRAALDDLVREGYLVRRRGAGTFVSEPKIAQELTMTSFTEDMRRRGMVPASRTLELRIVAGRRAARPHPARLALRAGRRRRSGFGSPTARRWRSRRCTCASRSSPASPAATSSGSRSTSCSSERYGIDIVGGMQTIEPTVTNEEESEALGVPLHSPAFLFERITRAAERRDRRVRPLDLPRRPLPARHRAQRARPPRAGVDRARSLEQRRPHCQAVVLAASAIIGLDNWLSDVPMLAPVAKWYKPIGRPRSRPAGHRHGTRATGRLSMRLGDPMHESTHHRRRRPGSCAAASRSAAVDASGGTQRREQHHRLAAGRRADAAGREIVDGGERRSSSRSTPASNVNVQYQTWGNHLQKFDATLAGGNAPDVIEMGNTEMTKYMAAGAFRT